MMAFKCSDHLTIFILLLKALSYMGLHYFKSTSNVILEFTLLNISIQFIFKFLSRNNSKETIEAMHVFRANKKTPSRLQEML